MGCLLEKNVFSEDKKVFTERWLIGRKDCAEMVSIRQKILVEVLTDNTHLNFCYSTFKKKKKSMLMTFDND